MRDFFRLWRRKIGVLTLVMACLAMGGWVRSLHTVDLAQFGNLTHKTNGFASASGVIGCFQWDRNNWTYLQQNSPSFQTDGRVWQSGPAEFFALSTHNDPFFRHNRLLPFQMQIDRDLGPDRSRLESEGIWGQNVIANGTAVVIPYSNILFFLTLISAVLLLSTPRQLKPQSLPPSLPETAV